MAQFLSHSRGEIEWEILPHRKARLRELTTYTYSMEVNTGAHKFSLNVDPDGNFEVTWVNKPTSNELLNHRYSVNPVSGSSDRSASYTLLVYVAFASQSKFSDA